MTARHEMVFDAPVRDQRIRGYLNAAQRHARRQPHGDLVFETMIPAMVKRARGVDDEVAATWLPTPGEVGP